VKPQKGRRKGVLPGKSAKGYANKTAAAAPAAEKVKKYSLKGAKIVLEWKEEMEDKLKIGEIVERQIGKTKHTFKRKDENLQDASHPWTNASHEFILHTAEVDGKETNKDWVVVLEDQCRGFARGTLINSSTFGSAANKAIR
jgi:hypothetical protein